MASYRGNANVQAGGALVFLGSLLYFLIYFLWYSGGYPTSIWLGTASFLAPFVVAMALFSSISLFFMSLGSMGSRTAPDRSMNMMLWKFIMIAGVTFIIITGGTTFFSWVLIALVLTYLGGVAATPM